jgi:hypothetical protein
MNLRHHTQLHRHNARQPFGPHSRRPRPQVNWWGVVLPLLLLLSSAGLVSGWEVLQAWLRSAPL